jgi:hypothetical protein
MFYMRSWMSAMNFAAVRGHNQRPVNEYDHVRAVVARYFDRHGRRTAGVRGLQVLARDNNLDQALRV